MRSRLKIDGEIKLMIGMLAAMLEKHLHLM